MSFRALYLLAIALLLGALPAQALRFYVDGTPGGNGDDRRSVQSAQNPETPFRTIAHALRVAHLVHEGRPHLIEVMPGTYSPSTGQTFPLEISQKDIYIRTSGKTVFDAEGKSNFYQITVPTKSFVIAGIDFHNGSAAKGGAIYCKTCTLDVHDNRFFSNQASQAGHVLYSEAGRVKFVNNQLRNNGSGASAVPVIELHDTFADTSKREVVRNNTFYRNYSPNILSSGNRTDIDSNIFFDAEQPAILDTSTTNDPLVRYNLFWDTEILYIGDAGDSIKVLRTVRDTLTLAEQGVLVPPFVTSPPDTVAQAGSPYHYEIPVEGEKTFYDFNPLTLPAGISSQRVDEQKVIDWTPTLADTGRHEIRVELITPVGVVDFLHYNLRVYTAENFPDTTYKGPEVTITLEPDTTGAIADLDALVPIFSPAASAERDSNYYRNPTFLDTTINRFELVTGSGAIDRGNPIAALNDAPGRPTAQGDTRRNNVGDGGGPLSVGPPNPDTTFVELALTNLPDSVAVQGQTYTYNPTLDDGAIRIDLVDLIPDYGAPTMDPFRTFGKRPPITWTPTIADTGSYLIGVKVYTNRGEGRQYFPLRVKPLNEAPVVSSSPDTVAFEDSLYSYAIQAADANGDTLTFVIDSAPSGMTVDAASGLLRWTPTQQAVGDHPVNIRIDDGRGASTFHQFTLTVLNTNDPPTIASSPDTTAVEDSLYTYAIQAADPDPVDTLTYALTSAPATAQIDTAGRIRWTPTQADVGTASFAIRVSDAAGDSAVQSFQIRVAEIDDPPTIASSPDTTAVEDSLYTYAVQATDEEGGRLTYALTSAPATAQIDTAGRIRWTPTQADVGTASFAVRLSDPAGQTAEQSFQIQVAEVDDPPVITSVTPAADSLFLTPPDVPVLFLVEASDEEGDSLSFSWLSNGTPIELAAGSSLEHLPDPAVLDTLTARVSDRSSTTSVTWIIDGRRIPRVAVSADSADFGAIAIGDTGRVVLQVTNEGNSPLNISALQVGDLRFAASFSASTVPVEGTVALELRFAPTGRPAITSTITFATDDPDRPTVDLPVAGSGILPTGVTLDLDPQTGDQGATSAEVATGQTVALALYATKAVGLNSFKALLSYDSNSLNFLSVAARSTAEANLLDGEGVQVEPVVSQPIDDLLQITATAAAGGAAANGDGLLALVSFTADSSLAEQEQTAIRLLQVVLTGATPQQSDTLQAELEVQLRLLALPADFNRDGVVDFEDFFLFADHFGQEDPFYDLNGSGGPVDFEDFFLFADSFGQSSGKRLSIPADGPALLALQPLDSGGDQVDFAVYWKDARPLRGYALSLEFDPTILEFQEFTAAESAPLLWVVDQARNAVTVASGLPSEYEGRQTEGWGLLRFTRRSPEAIQLSPLGALAYVEGKTVALAAPDAVELEALPRDFLLYPPHPNPFNPETVLPFYLPRETRVRLRVYDLLGRPVRTLENRFMERGYHALTWRGRDDRGRPVGAGIYLAELWTGEFRQVRKLLLLK